MAQQEQYGQKGEADKKSQGGLRRTVLSAARCSVLLLFSSLTEVCFRTKCTLTLTAKIGVKKFCSQLSQLKQKTFGRLRSPDNGTADTALTAADGRSGDSSP